MKSRDMNRGETLRFYGTEYLLFIYIGTTDVQVKFLKQKEYTGKCFAVTNVSGALQKFYP